MIKTVKWIAVIITSFITIALATSYAPDTNKDEMLVKYGGSQARFVELPRGGKVHYRDEGEKHAAAIVMVHGMGSHLQTWEPLIAEIKEDYRIISLDLPGFGLTGPVPENKYNPQSYIDAIIAVMNAADIDKAVILGNSMGGWTAWRMGLSHPERVNGLILLAPWGAPGKGNETGSLAFKAMSSPIGKS